MNYYCFADRLLAAKTLRGFVRCEETGGAACCNAAGACKLTSPRWQPSAGSEPTAVSGQGCPETTHIGSPTDDCGLLTDDQFAADSVDDSLFWVMMLRNDYCIYTADLEAVEELFPARCLVLDECPS